MTMNIGKVPLPLRFLGPILGIWPLEHGNSINGLQINKCLILNG